MKFINDIFILLLLLITSCTFGYSEKEIQENYHAVIIVSVLEEMYWLEYSGNFTKSELDEFDITVQTRIEDTLKTRLTPELIERIKRLRKDTNYDNQDN